MSDQKKDTEPAADRTDHQAQTEEDKNIPMISETHKSPSMGPSRQVQPKASVDSPTDGMNATPKG